MASEVPISTKPLPPVNSSGRSTDGRIEYFTGPNKVDCIPVQNSATSNTGMLCSTNPSAASDMMTISIEVVITISFCFSTRAAICPAVAENRKNGRMKIAGARLAYNPIWLLLTAMYASSPMMACRYTLSLNAPSACTVKYGKKRRCVSRLNWL